MFDYRSSWESINHQDGDGGQFELYRNGEWLTKEMSNYDNNDLGQTSVYHNTLALQNHCSCPGGQLATCSGLKPENGLTAASGYSLKTQAIQRPSAAMARAMYTRRAT